MDGYKLVLSESKIIISGLSLLLKQNGVTPIVKSGTIPGYELTLDMDELYVDTPAQKSNTAILMIFKAKPFTKRPI